MSLLGHIAIVEDDPVVADALSIYASSAGYRCSTYFTAEDFLEALQPVNAPDCIIVDLFLPGMSGADVLKHLRAELYWIPAVALTAWPQNAVKELVDLPDDVALYVKPVEGSELIDRVAELIATRSLRDPTRS